jgi:PHD/YefM family antitoxin component YafN of YafNO toxin-antitoxin module
MSNTTYSISQARSNLSDIFDKVFFGGDPVKISRGKSKKQEVVVISKEEWEDLEAARDAIEAKYAKKLIREFEKSGEKGRPIADLWKEMGLK